MKEYKIIFENGVVEKIKAESIEYNSHIGRIEINDENGEELEEVYIDFDQITAIIPQS